MAKGKKGQEPVVEKTKKEILIGEIDNLIVQCNESKEYSEYKRVKKLENDIAEKVGEYTNEVRLDAYEGFKKTDDPMRAAIETYLLKTVKVSDKKQKEGGSKMVREDTMKQIDLYDLHKFIPGGIGVNKDWDLYVQNLNKHLTDRRAKELGLDIDVNSNYRMSDEARKLDCFYTDDGKEFDIVAANACLKKNMQLVVDAMIGEGYEVPDERMSYLLGVYSKKDSKEICTLTCASHAKLRQYMMDVCYLLITGKKPGFKYKRITGDETK